MAQLKMSAQAIVTLSSSAQLEAFVFGVSAFILRKETELTELVEAGWNRLVPEGHGDTIATMLLALDTLPKQPIASYGDGAPQALRSPKTCCVARRADRLPPAARQQRDGTPHDRPGGHHQAVEESRADTWK